MKAYLRSAGCDFDFILFSSYDRQVEALLDGQIDIAWNGPLAHCRTKLRTGGTSLSLGMRDVDRDFLSHVVVRKDSNISDLGSLAGARLATGTFDSPQAYVLPMASLPSETLATLDVTRFDRDVGKHGDTAAGELEVIDALMEGRAEAGFVSDIMWQRALQDGPSVGNTLAVCPALPIPRFDHCQFDALATLAPAKRESFSSALFSMTMSDPAAAHAMKLEGIQECWEDGVSRDDIGYSGMLDALKAEEPGPFPGPLHTLESHPFRSLTVSTLDPAVDPVAPMVRSCAAV